jgi:hypothetical protein
MGRRNNQWTNGNFSIGAEGGFLWEKGTKQGLTPFGRQRAMDPGIHGMDCMNGEPLKEA